MSLSGGKGDQEFESVPATVGAADRLDRLPRTKYYWAVLGLAALGWICLSYDIGLVGSILPSLKKVFDITASESGYIVGSSTLGIVIGLIPAGHISDKFGRRNVLIVGIIWYSVFSLLSALSPSWIWFAVLRLIMGIGLGATFPVPYTYMAELTPSRHRGAATSILDSFLSIGYFIAPLLAIGIIPSLATDVGWRVLTAFGALPLLYALAVFLFLPESPRWLELHNHFDKAEKVIQLFESKAEARLGYKLEPLAEYAPMLIVKIKGTLWPQFKSLWTNGYWRRTVMLWVGYIGGLAAFYAFTNFMPTVLVDRHVALAKAFAFAAIVNGGAIPSKYVLAFLIEKMGRKGSVILYLTLSVIGIGIVAISHNITVLVVGAGVGAAFGTASAVPFKAYAGELYPTRMRGIGAGGMEACGRLFAGVLAPYLFAVLLPSAGIGGSFAFLGAVLVILGIVPVVLLAPETKGRFLEDVSEIHGKEVAIID